MIQSAQKNKRERKRERESDRQTDLLLLSRAAITEVYCNCDVLFINFHTVATGIVVTQESMMKQS